MHDLIDYAILRIIWWLLLGRRDAGYLRTGAQGGGKDPALDGEGYPQGGSCRE